MNPCQPDASPLVQVGPMRMRRETLERMRLEYPKLTDEAIALKLIEARGGPRQTRAKKESAAP